MVCRDPGTGILCLQHRGSVTFIQDKEGLILNKTDVQNENGASQFMRLF